MGGRGWKNSVAHNGLQLYKITVVIVSFSKSSHCYQVCLQFCVF